MASRRHPPITRSNRERREWRDDSASAAVRARWIRCASSLSEVLEADIRAADDSSPCASAADDRMEVSLLRRASVASVISTGRGVGSSRTSR
eukprot:scaffold33875_cov27-Tisochrysis_lutea.AAC.5